MSATLTPTSTITTTWNGGQVSNPAGNQTVEAWLADHCADLEGATISGNSLTTSWVSDGAGHSAKTDRRPGETDEHFVLRHEIEFLQDMVGAPPN